jgi:DNA-binding response OmpR family regulator
MKKILIVEDDVNLGTPLQGALQAQKYNVLYLTGGEKVMEELHAFQPDIVLLDVMLNEEKDGFEISREIRSVSKVPILFTTSREGNDDIEAGFNIGNSDYVRKPYRLIEVGKRIEKMLATHSREQSFRFGHFTFFPVERSLKYDCSNIHLNNYESAVLTILCENPGVFIKRSTIIEMVWNEKDSKIKEGSLNNIVSNLRKYLQKDNQIELETKIGLGIRMVLKGKE